jgi:hypothetical protein
MLENDSVPGEETRSLESSSLLSHIDGLGHMAMVALKFNLLILIDKNVETSAPKS